MARQAQLGPLQERILQILLPSPDSQFTIDQLVRQLGRPTKPTTTVRGALHALLARGLVLHGGERASNRPGARAKLWSIDPTSRAVLERARTACPAVRARYQQLDQLVTGCATP